MSFYRDVEKLLHDYVRKGGKDNRRQQAKRVLSFALHCQGLGVRRSGELGRRHVIAYWKSLRRRGFREKTIYSHYLALKAMWEMLGRADLPPKPLHMLSLGPACETSGTSDTNLDAKSPVVSAESEAPKVVDPGESM